MEKTVRTGSGTVKVTNDVGHASLVAQNSSQVNGLLGVILQSAVSRKRKIVDSAVVRTLGKDLTFPR